MASLDPSVVIRRHLEAGAELRRQTAEQCAPLIAQAGVLVTEALRRGGRLLLCGNGGSAADCQHLAAEFVNTLNRANSRPSLGAIALTTDGAFLTANANDFGFEHVFERQVEAHGRPGDVLLALSTSGNSPNVVRALERARSQGLGTVVLTGEAGGNAAPLADVAIRVASGETQLIQEIHIAVGHILCDLVERALFPSA
jgi:D-sedoheptulose 7-phosphate isomerase